jgi:hypothetical protein
VERDGSESEAHLQLAPATLDSQLSELLAEQVARADYRIKSQVKQFWDVLAQLQAIRRDVQAAQRSTPQ